LYLTKTLLLNKLILDAYVTSSEMLIKDIFEKK